jgi:hypothetical protein
MRQIRVPSLSVSLRLSVKDSSLNLRFCSPVHNTVRATRKSEKEEETVVALLESGSRSDSQAKHGNETTTF